MRLKLVPSETSFDFMRLRMPALGFPDFLLPPQFCCLRLWASISALISAAVF